MSRLWDAFEWFMEWRWLRWSGWRGRLVRCTLPLWVAAVGALWLLLLGLVIVGWAIVTTLAWAWTGKTS